MLAAVAAAVAGLSTVQVVEVAIGIWTVKRETVPGAEEAAAAGLVAMEVEAVNQA